MRKNKKLLLGGLSVLTLVAAGSGAVSTFAWYQVSNVASITPSAKDGTLTTAKSDINLGSFTLAVSTANFDAQPVMTDDSGNTFAVTTDGDLVAASVPVGKVKIATVTLKIKISYGGSATSDDDAISNMWDATIGSKDVTVTASATGTIASRLKYTNSASAYTNVSGKNVVRVLNANLTGLTFTTKQTAEISCPAMYIGVDGGSKTEGEVQDDGTSALDTTVTFTPADVAAAG